MLPQFEEEEEPILNDPLFCDMEWTTRVRNAIYNQVAWPTHNRPGSPRFGPNIAFSELRLSHISRFTEAEILLIRNFGGLSLSQLKETLSEFGWRLADHPQKR